MKQLEFRKFTLSVVGWFYFNGTILLVIALDALCIGVQASEYVATNAGWYIQLLYQLYLAVYIVELFLRLYALRLNFFRSWWNIFSLFLIVIDVIGLFVLLMVHGIAIFNDSVFVLLRTLQVIQALRALRIIRTIKFMKNLRIIVSTLLESIPAIGAIVVTISLVLYIFAVIGRDLYGTVDPSRYGNLGKAVFTLFQLITLEDWFLMYTDINPGQEHILVFLILFIVIETLIFINLFVAVIVDNLARAQSHADFGMITEHEDEVIQSKNNILRTQERKPWGKQPDELQNISDPIQEYVTKFASLELHFTVAHKHQITLNKLVDIVDLSKS